MQNKGALKFLAIVLAIACLYQLSFTFVAKQVERQALESSDGNPIAEQAYLDSMKTQNVYNLGFIKYTYAEVKSKELNLGLDLKGGMNVMLEISVEDVLRALSGDSTDPIFNEAIVEARNASKTSGSDFLTLFANAYSAKDPSGLARIYSTYDLRESVSSNMTNNQVIDVLRQQIDDAISNSYNVLRNRIDRFGVTQPNIQRLENSSRILVELPGVKEPERVRKLLQGTASLEFWPTYSNTEILPLLQQVNSRLVTINEATQALEGGEAAQSEEDSFLDGIEIDSTLISDDFAKSMPLFTLLYPSVNPQTGAAYDSAEIGSAFAKDTAKVNSIFAMPQIKSILPRDLKLMWGVKAIDAAGTVYQLFAIKANTKDGKAPLDGLSVADARAQYEQNGSASVVSMVMNGQGARVWSRLTADNIGRQIAIVLDGYVYSAPNVNGEITGGISQISGGFTYTEANDLAIVLKSGKLPAPARIIQEAVVGPTLGQESIDAGMSSFIIAFVLVLIYMVLYYNQAGLVASIALIANLFFLFGVLASLGAVLTLPGIAGIVLTMGMAVDANVIIFERIKEEVRLGKGVTLSIADGFKNAYSAIIDGNATTLLTGIVLFIFGTGPIQGFATTLIIGIITSVFSAVFITRLIFVTLVEKGVNVKFSNKLTENVFANTKIDFVSFRKKAYIVSATILVVILASFLMRGMSYGVDFSGGHAYVVRFDQARTDSEVRTALANEFDESVEVKQFGEENQLRIVTKYKYDVTDENVTDEINEMMYKALLPLYTTPISFEEFATNNNIYGVISSDKVGPNVANDIKQNAVIAIIFSLLAIGLYIAIRFRRWEWAMGGIVSLLHDAFITIGVFSLFWGVLPFNLDVDQSFIAAILTIIGYSINDTVIIFDRIREYNALYPKRTLKQNINDAVNSTIARTINTSGTTFIVLLTIFILGGEVIRGFIFALMVGVFIGTFSSVFVATPVAYDFMMRKAKKVK
ncbi:MAG: protein translocase subunit SecDF [Rikenellaceae bacterium]